MVSGTLQRLSKHQDQYQCSLLPAQQEEQGGQQPRGMSHCLQRLREPLSWTLKKAFLEVMGTLSDWLGEENQVFFIHITCQLWLAWVPMATRDSQTDCHVKEVTGYPSRKYAICPKPCGYKFDDMSVPLQEGHSCHKAVKKGITSLVSFLATSFCGSPMCWWQDSKEMPAKSLL